jgi:hypothetical protein
MYVALNEPVSLRGTVTPFAVVSPRTKLIVEDEGYDRGLGPR